MAKNDDKLEQLSREIEEIRETVKLNSELLNKFESHYFPTIFDLFPGVVVSLIKSVYVCADSRSDLPGAYKEGKQVKATLSKGHNVTLDSHPVKKADFLSNLKNNYIVHLAGHGGSYNGQVVYGFKDDVAYPKDITYGPSLLMYAGTCYSAQNKTMANAFLTKGTKCYVGFRKTGGDWTFKYFDDLVYKKWLVERKSLETALDEADDIHPSLNHWEKWP